jgi:hypothetical protein
LIRLLRDSDGSPVTADPSDVLGTGARGRVLGTYGQPGLAAKLFPVPTAEQERKIRVMLAHPPAPVPSEAEGGSPALAWPVDLLRDEEGGFAGFLMPRVWGAHRLSDLRDPAARAAASPGAHYGLLHRGAASLAGTFDTLHAAGCVAGSIDDADVLVDAEGRVTLVGVDALQVTDPATGEVFAGPADRLDLAPPELHGWRGPAVRGPEQDRFTLGVLVFQLLMEGAHPFAGEYAGPGESPSIAARIAGGMFPYLPGSPFRRPPQAPPVDALDPAVRELVRRCFDAGHRNPAARPEPREWLSALASAEAALVGCTASPLHRFGRDVDACPWCEVLRTTGRDPFPPHASTGPASTPAPVAPLPRPVTPAPAPAGPPRPKPAGAGRRPRIPASTGFGPMGEAGMWLAGVATAALLGFAAGSPRVFLLLLACIVFGAAMRLLDRSAGGSLALMAGALAVAVTGIGWTGKRPPAGAGPDPDAYELTSEEDARSHLTFEPTALDSRPVPTRPAELSAALENLRVPDSVAVSFVVDAAGRVDPSSIRLPDPAPRGTDEMRAALAGPVFFRPGVRHGSAVRTRVDVLLRKTTVGVRALLADATWNEKHPSGTQPLAPRLLMPDTATAIAPPSGPRTVRMAVQRSPVMLNHAQVLRGFERAYPPSARGGEVHVTEVRFRITTAGMVDPASLTAETPMEHPDSAFAQAALRAVAGARYRPALVDGRPATVWISLPVVATPGSAGQPR